MSHVGWPSIPGVMPEHILQLEAAQHAIEQHRDPCLRGDRKPTQAIVDECEQGFQQALDIYRQAIR